MALVVQTSPGVEPLTVADAQEHLKMDGVPDGGYVAALIKSARQYVESIQNRSFINTTWDLWLDEWPQGREIVLPRAPLSSVTSVVFYDEDDTESTLAASDYIVDTYSEPGRIVLKDGSLWPSGTLRAANAIRARFVAGYGSSASDVPDDTVHLIRLVLAHWYDHREPEVVGTITKSVPHALDSLIWKDRLVLRV